MAPNLWDTLYSVSWYGDAIETSWKKEIVKNFGSFTCISHLLGGIDENHYSVIFGFILLMLMF
jgi:hypothetical protein